MYGDVFPLAGRAPRRSRLVLALLAALLASCSSWREVSSHEDWSLYVKPGGGVDVQSFEELLGPAVAAVEGQFGPFEAPVRIHAWSGGVDLETGNRGRIADGDDAGLINAKAGTARVRAFHVRADPFGPGGVFLGEASAGSAVHELVHARFAETDVELPLWFEEGLAMHFADGVLTESTPVWAAPEGVPPAAPSALDAATPSGPRWVRDGLCAWPLSRLRELEFTDDELTSLLALRAEDGHSIEENLVVHFLGWALVFDLYREHPNGDWRDWLAVHKADPSIATVRARIARSIDPETVRLWLHTGLTSDDPAVRRATARGSWRVADSASLQLMSSALRKETDEAVRATLVINILAAAGEGRYPGMGRWNGLRLPLRLLSSLVFTDAAEAAAAGILDEGYRRGATREEISAAFEVLEKYWQE
ncbi:MAG: HEAT repeat domain-containing protein [Planctomycetota bacterium]|nr:HEAT repeat domain-containing protein [Planctomycetota bacterium]